MTTGRDRTIGIVWLIAAAVLGVALVAGAVQVIGDTTAERAFSWVMALLFLGGSLAWLTAYHQDALRRFFGRNDTMTP